jgi:hypothetical protein
MGDFVFHHDDRAINGVSMLVILAAVAFTAAAVIIEHDAGWPGMLAGGCLLCGGVALSVGAISIYVKSRVKN